VVSHVGREPAGALRKGDPQPAGRRHPGTEPRQLGFQLGALRDERNDHVVPGVVHEVGVHAGDVGHRPERVLEPFRCADQGNFVPFADAELARQRRARVVSLRGHVAPP
jgi:hypothetical protein